MTPDSTCFGRSRVVQVMTPSTTGEVARSD
jgi:hypothetical protein